MRHLSRVAVVAILSLDSAKVLQYSRRLIIVQDQLSMLEPGQIVGNKYRIDRLIGQGGLSDVYLATNIPAANRVVIRCVRQQDEASQALILRESRLLHLLSHPSIVKIEDTFLEDLHLYIVQAYIDGEPLDLLQPRPLVDLVRVFAGIAGG